MKRMRYYILPAQIRSEILSPLAGTIQFKVNSKTYSREVLALFGCQRSIQLACDLLKEIRLCGLQ